ncbi:unnamed protein product [Pichia kudriavzevii]
MSELVAEPAGQSEQLDKQLDTFSAESDDDFGDFEEVDQGDSGVYSNDLSANKEGRIRSYSGNFATIAADISQNLDKIFNESKGNSENEYKDSFLFDERADQIFNRLISEEDDYLSPFIWKQSMIYKQVLLNLEIEPRAHVTYAKRQLPSANGSRKEFKNLYDFLKSSSTNAELDKLLLQVPDFSQLGIDKDGEEYNQIINNTTSTISEAKKLLRSGSVSELINLKERLLKLVSVWDVKSHDINEDNELFSSYVENLIGNTLKKRREKRQAKASKSKKRLK